MSDEFDDEYLGDFLEKYTGLKKTGVKCDPKEARKFYRGVLRESQSRLNQGLGFFILNMAQNIPITKVDKENLDNILMDCDDITSMIKSFNMAIQMAYDLYNSPGNYDCWKGDIDGELVYYVELKKDKKDELLYI